MTIAGPASDVFEFLRAANVALYCSVLYFFGIRIADTASRGRRILMGFVALVFVAIIGGSAINYLVDAPLNPAIVVFTIAGVGIHWGLWVSRHDPDIVRHPRKRDL